MNEAEKVVCVTGASGYVASWLVKLLLQRGYTVKATVRDPNDPKKTEHLLSLDGAKERLHLFKAELVDEGCFDSVVDGCQGVFHTASPVFISAADPQAEIIDPAVKGTLNVLKSCAKVPSIKRVVITSSLASVIYNGKPLTPDVVVDETWFSDPRLSEENKEWYTLSKTLAEEAAWRFAKENGIDLVSINPGLVFGPLLQPALNSSPLVILHLAKGEHIFPTSSYYRVVDVRDVAYAHIQAFEVPSASGRYCLVERVIQFPEVQKILCEIYPTNLHFKAKYEDYHNKPLERTYQISKEKAKGLGVSFIPFELEMSSAAEKVVCVTGASGYIASWLVKLLLQRGYTVKATVRDPNDPKKTEHLLALDGAKERLHLFKAELVDEGCQGIAADTLGKFVCQWSSLDCVASCYQS
ncbi:NAD(P)-binding Rossmann-fold superfamily protein [Theobroma cacao]|uniref:NAD(P)-binding Rossmann-fold superfamily protein n=1 Tax=Theobroma cacao TaxID=3641 RepID=A0A061DX47_THECC|nr:NAD(P)-binding Rossmann-fold superfamily protein [Theobroma cacao]